MLASPLRNTLLCGLITFSALTSPTLHAAPDPVEFQKNARQTPERADVGYGEQFCWFVNYSAGYFVEGYEAFGDPEWINQGQVYFDWAISKMQKDPDGYPGWIGPHIGEEKKADLKYHTDTVVGDSILLVSILGWAETVLKDPELKARFGSKAQEYVALGETVLWEKFNKRGQLYTCAAGWVSYPQYGKMIRIADWQWEDFPDRLISDNLNKHLDLAHGLLRLYRITGKEEYKQRAIAVFGRSKAMFRHYPEQDRFVWNFWMPHAPYDIEGQAPRSWVSVHPDRAGYQAGEVEMFVEAYDTGIVFTKEDMERIGRTNAWMGENGWCNAEGGTAGTVWGAIARFNPKVAEFYEASLAKERGERGEVNSAYYEKVRKPLGTKRRYREPAEGDLVDVPLKGGEQLTMSQVIPNKIELANNDRLQLVTKTNKGGQLTVDLMDAAAKSKLGTVYQTTHEKGQYDAPLWDGTVDGKKVAPGQYTLRWNFLGDVRDEPVWIVEGTKKAPSASSRPVLAKGQTIQDGFETPTLAKAWKVSQAEISTDHAYKGDKSLKIEGTAELIFGEDKREDLPVKVSMWVLDPGPPDGNQNGNGPMWGVQTTLGDKLVWGLVWRGYLKGDERYAWFNTAENQFFSPHPSFARSEGWRHWVFDFTGAEAVITVDGEPSADIDPKWQPKGCVAIHLRNGSISGPLYVDEVMVEYP